MNISCLSNVNNGARLISLALLSGGSAMVTFVAITLVKAATAEGVPVAEAAFRNGPAFIKFSYIAMAAGGILFATEVLDLLMRREALSKGFLSKPLLVRYISSFVCILCMHIFGLVFALPMGKLMPEIKTNEEAHAQFDKLHHGSRIVFGVATLAAFISLVIPVGACLPKSND